METANSLFFSSLIFFSNWLGPQSLKLFCHQNWILVSSPMCSTICALKSSRIKPIICLVHFFPWLLSTNREKLYHHIKNLWFSFLLPSVTDNISLGCSWSAPSPDSEPVILTSVLSSAPHTSCSLMASTSTSPKERNAIGINFSNLLPNLPSCLYFH